MKHRSTGATIAIFLQKAATGPSSAGEIVIHSRPPPTFGAAPTEVHRIRDGVIGIDRRFEHGDPKIALLRQRYTRADQTFVFETVRSLDGILLGVHAMDDPIAAPPPVELRHDTGQVETHLGLRCRVWEFVRPTGHQRTFMQSGCSTAKGIELWRKQASIPFA